MGCIGTLLEASAGQPDSRQSRTSGSGTESFKRRWKCGDRNCRSAGPHSGCVLSFSSQLVFNCSHSIVRLPASTDDGISDLPQTGNSREKWIGGRLAGRTRKIFEAIIGKTHGLWQACRRYLRVYRNVHTITERSFREVSTFLATALLNSRDIGSGSFPPPIYALHIDTRSTGPSTRRLTSIRLSPRVPRHRLLSDTCSV